MTKAASRLQTLLAAACCFFLTVPAVAGDHVRYHIDWEEMRLTIHASAVIPDAGRNSPAAPQRSVRQLEQQVPEFLFQALQQVPLSNGELVSGNQLLMNRILSDIEKIDSSGTYEYSRVSADLRSVSIQRHYPLAQIISSRYIQHDVPRPIPRRLGWSPSSEYTGLIIYAAHTDAAAALFPRLLNQDGQVIFDRSMNHPERLREENLVQYASNPESSAIPARVGLNPKMITAYEAATSGSSDLIIHNNDVHALLRTPSIRSAMQAGRIVIILSDESLSVHY
ncbi:hypothetical protein [Spirochaeta dissipatitropha]